MSKQDRQGVRKATDIERKYNLAVLDSFKPGAVDHADVNKLNQTLAQYMAETNASIEALREQIYPVGSVYVSFSDSEPTLLYGGVWELMAEGHIVVGTTEERELLRYEDKCFLWKRIE